MSSMRKFILREVKKCLSCPIAFKCNIWELNLYSVRHQSLWAFHSRYFNFKLLISNTGFKCMLKKMLDIMKEVRRNGRSFWVHDILRQFSRFSSFCHFKWLFKGEICTLNSLPLVLFPHLPRKSYSPALTLNL